MERWEEQEQPQPQPRCQHRTNELAYSITIKNLSKLILHLCFYCDVIKLTPFSFNSEFIEGHFMAKLFSNYCKTYDLLVGKRHRPDVGKDIGPIWVRSRPNCGNDIRHL